MAKTKTVPILGQLYTVEYVDLGRYQGESDGDEHSIKVHEDLDGTERRDATVHEILHSILHESGLTHLLTDELEEALVRALEHGLCRSGVFFTRWPL